MSLSRPEELRLQGVRLADRAGGRDNNFNLIRMVAASGVLVSHAWPISLGPGTMQPLQATLHGITLGSVCVAVFFAVSGFFITRSFDTRRDPLVFVLARVWRLFPALITVLMVTVIVAGLFLTTAEAGIFWPAAPGYFFGNLSLAFLRYELPGVFEGNPYGPPINGSLWTLFYEVACYIGVFCAGMAGLIARPKGFAVAVAVFLAFYAAAAALDLPGRLERFADLGLPFLIGACFWVWRDRIRLSVFSLAGLAVLLALLWTTPLFKAALVLFLVYAVFLIGYARLPGLNIYNRLGDYSYGMYVWAFPIQQGVAATGVVSPWVNIVIATPVTLVCAMLSWHLVEAPAMRFGRFRRGQNLPETTRI